MVWMILISWAPTSALYEVGWCAFLYLNVLVLEFVQVPLEQLGWGRALRILRAIYIPIMLLGVTLSHLHQSSLGTLMTLPAQGACPVVVGSVAIALSLFCHHGRSGHGDPRTPRRRALARLRAAHGSARRPRPHRGLARWAFSHVPNGRSRYRGAVGAMLSGTWFALSFWVEIGFGLLLPFACCRRGARRRADSLQHAGW